MPNSKVVVAMSGGVDSSVAAALLQRQGYDVTGITMCFNLEDAVGSKPNCCGRQGIDDARRVAHKLGVRHYVLNMQQALREFVITDFCKEYAAGRTPNPCVRCNQYVKFGALLKKALALGASHLATGHYARIGRSASGFVLLKAKDLLKDQSYFLYRLNQRQLRHLLFPLGDYTKPQIRALARECGLPVAEKPESQEICFVPNADYRSFLRGAVHFKSGPIIDRQGTVLGKHEGLAFYTIGQRQGLKVAYSHPLYVIDIDKRRNTLTVGAKTEAFRRSLVVKQPSFTSGPIKKKVALRVRIRYNHNEAPALILPTGSKLKVTFTKPQFAVTPGQSAVFYDGDRVVGGGIIEKIPFGLKR